MAALWRTHSVQLELDIRVQPRASRNAIEIDGERITVRVTAAPESGKANDAVVALLAKRLRVPKRSIADRARSQVARQAHSH